MTVVGGGGALGAPPFSREIGKRRAPWRTGPRRTNLVSILLREEKGESMHHGYMYGGSYELNYDGLTAGSERYRSTSGEDKALPIWPESVDGVRVWYMEKAGKKFYAVRLQFESHDIVLAHPVAIDPLRHMNNRRFSAQPTLVRDDQMTTLLDDVIRENPEAQPELAMLINRVNQVRRAARTEKAVQE